MEYLVFTVHSDQPGKRKKLIEKATLIPFAWGLFLSLQITKNAAEIFRTFGLLFATEKLLQAGNL